jgi:hypothetical protein
VLIRMPVSKPALEISRHAFARVMDDAADVESRTKMCEVWILVTKDPPTGRTKTFNVGPVRTKMRLGREWNDWKLFWRGPWSTYNADRVRYEPDTATLVREAREAGACGARCAVRSTLQITT